MLGHLKLAAPLALEGRILTETTMLQIQCQQGIVEEPVCLCEGEVDGVVNTLEVSRFQMGHLHQLPS